MHEDFEAELRMALAEGLIAREEVEPLREESLRTGKSPMELLEARGVISDESLADLRKADVEATFVPRAAATGGAETLGPALTLADRDKADPSFPVPGWERYEGVRFLGQGGMGRVFLAYDRSLRRNVALKFVRGDDELLVRRLMSEARAQARVEHERVCQVHEVGEVQGKPYIAMQFVDGLPLDRLASELKLTVEQKVLVLREASEGVHAAHRAGLIHRDLKPSNILVERTDDGRLKPFVMDFGLAHDWSEKGTISSGSAVGTPHYMAPEQARGEVEGLDRRADVYSLGATLYFLLTGHQAIPGANGLEVLNSIATVEPTPPRALDPNVPTDLEAIVLKCLEKDRSARYDSARALIEDLDRFLAGEPVQARSTGLWYRLRKKALKHRLVVSVAAAALLAVTLALGSALYTHSQATRREQLARSFTEKVEHIEALARYSGLSPLHDTREDREKIRARMDELEGQIREAGTLAVGPGHYALARGYLALGDEASARMHLELAWQSGFTDPRVAYALALVRGHQDQDQLLEAERQRSIEERRRDIQARYRDPALDWLRRSQGADVPSSEYVAALIAFYEDDFDGALARLDALVNRLPWFYEAPQLRGDILQARAARRWNQGGAGGLEGARADFEAGRRAYAAAAAIGESVPAVHQALAKLEYTAMIVEVYSQGDVLASFNQGMAAVTRALQASPEDPASLMLKARFHRRLADNQNNRWLDAQGSVDEALAAARAALQHGQPAWEVQLELGRIFLQQARARNNRHEDPFESLRQAEQALQAVDLKNRDYEFHTVRGLILSQWATYEDDVGARSQEHRNQAIEALREATRLDPRIPDAWINLGRAYFKRGLRSGDVDGASGTLPPREEDLKQAWEANRRALELNPKHWVAYYYGAEVNEERAELRKCFDDAPSLLAQALELYRQGLTINSRSQQLQSGVGTTLLSQARQAWSSGGDPFPLLDEAQKAFEQALVLAPPQVHAYNNLGQVHALRALYRSVRGEEPTPHVRAAVASFEKALQLAPDESLPRTNLGKVLETLAEYELSRGRDPSATLQRSEKELREALHHNPGSAEAWGYLGETHALLLRWKARHGQVREEAFMEAASDFDKSLKLAPDRYDTQLASASLHHTWALWKKETGRVPAPQLERGLALVEEVLKSCPGHPEALQLRAKWLNPGGLQGPH